MPTNDKWDIMKFQSLYVTKKAVNQVKRWPTEWDKVFPSYIRRMINI